MKFHSLTVLILDPDAQARQQMTDALAERYIAVSANNSDEAERVLWQQHPQFLLIDPDLRGADGLDFIRWLRQSSAFPSLIIVCLTHRDTTKDKVAGFLAGADDYVVKPANLSTFPFRLQLLYRTKQTA